MDGWIGGSVPCRRIMGMSRPTHSLLGYHQPAQVNTAPARMAPQLVLINACQHGRRLVGSKKLNEDSIHS